MAETQVAIVTGASQGIGKAIALRLAEDGFDIALNDIPRGKENLEALSKEIESTGRKTYIYIADVSVESEVKSMVASVVEALGSVDVMVANAGIAITKPFLETTVDDWDRVLRVNGRGVFLCYQYAAKQMVKQGKGGRLIGASSVLGKRGMELLGPYSASKFAVRGLTQSVATELGKYGITVNAYAPGAIETEMLEGLGVAFGDKEGFYAKMRSDAPMGYNGTPVDVANIVSFLASKKSHFVTGQSISVNGGLFFD
ncbi:acetoin reductase family protein [Crucibulum laeve]|uniref:Acetoin reductase family protein n=1 Tax=Crucibulum laeve TaxID=68775 RepID=A0A5C3LKK7_9AGAR|nr:acetoin reductase family protein [Crucibulum laeve]